jgi:hypothetical protein
VYARLRRPYADPAIRAKKVVPSGSGTVAVQRTIDGASEVVMSKGMDQKKSEKKKPAKTLKEKRAEKNEKKKTK